MQLMTAPDRNEAIEYYFRYIDQVGAGDIRDLLEQQRTEVLALARGISEEGSRHRYAAGKWSLREVLSHINDCERVFALRSFWFARGLEAPLPGFEQDDVMRTAGADARSWKSHVDEFDAVRAGTVALFRNLPEDAWSRRGTASGNPFTVRALAWITVGHAAHHVKIVREKYLPIPG